MIGNYLLGSKYIWPQLSYGLYQWLLFYVLRSESPDASREKKEAEAAPKKKEQIKVTGQVMGHLTDEGEEQCDQKKIAKCL